MRGNYVSSHHSLILVTLMLPVGVNADKIYESYGAHCCGSELCFLILSE